jgi:hypothetical protein
MASFKRLGRIPAVVDFVANGSRFKIMIPKENIKLTVRMQREKYVDYNHLVCTWGHSLSKSRAIGR